jgi:hypothetical protein
LLGFAAAAAPAGAAPLPVYADALQGGFQDYSYADHALNHANPVHAGAASVRFNPGAFDGVQFVDPVADFRTTDYQALRFWIHGGTTGGQSLRVQLRLDDFFVFDADLAQFVAGGIAAGQWREAVVPFDAQGLTHGAFDGVAIQGFNLTPQATVYIDDIGFDERAAPLGAPSIAVAVDFAQDRRAINPEIYGVNFGTDGQHADLRYPVRRRGGNSTTRYNWQLDVHNTAFDYFFQNIVDDALDPMQLPSGSSADQFMDATRQHGGEAIQTLNTLGRVPVDVREKRFGFRISVYGPQDSDECRFYFGNDPVPPGHFCTADSGNGECENSPGPNCAGGKIVGNNPADTSKVVVAPIYAAAWVLHMRSRYGTAANGGIKYFALDNEPMLWNSTHRDVHPIAPDYEEVWEKGRDVAIAVKQQEPGALIFGPDTWGWCDLHTSAQDVEANGQFGSCITGPERTAHGNLEFARWYLQQAAAYQQANGTRLIDFMDIHWYPQGAVSGLGGASDSELPADSARRLRSIRELWDSTYISESYVDDEVFLIPRLKNWIALDYPGTKLAITEYKWGPDDGPSGSLAQAEVLAVFGREGLDLATRWVAPDPGTRSEDAFRMYLDHDGANTRLIGDSVRTTSANHGELGAYTIDRPGVATYLLLFNKATGPRTATVTFSQALDGAWTLRRFDAAAPLAIVQSGNIAGTTLTLGEIPGRSANLVVLPARNAAAELIFTDSFETP